MTQPTVARSGGLLSEGSSTHRLLRASRPGGLDMKIQLINSAGCVLDTFEGDQDAICYKVGAWLLDIQKGDRIAVLEVDEDDDPLDDFNYVGSRHHY